MSSALPSYLVEYLERRDAERAESVNAVLNGFTERERALVKEAAVMGYVQACLAKGRVDVPKDGTIVVKVIEGCLAHSDLYPTISGGES